MTAAERWSTQLAEWAIPPEILAAAPESPWGYSPTLFARRADEAVARDTPSSMIARAALPAGGSVLDVGCGAGAAALPLADRAGTLIGVDPSPRLLAEFAQRAAATRCRVQTIQGSWPESAGITPQADVALCHHVFYNVSDLETFVVELTKHARQRVVVELTRQHPMSNLNDLWLHFHGLVRPVGPTVDDAVAVLRELGMSPERLDWEAPASGRLIGLDELVPLTRRRLCLPAERDPEILAALEANPDLSGQSARSVSTLWWSV